MKREITIKDIKNMKNSLLKKGLDSYVNIANFFSNGIYGTYQQIWAGFISKNSPGGENTYKDAKKIHQEKMGFEYKMLNANKNIWNFIDHGIAFYLLNLINPSTKKISYHDVRYIENKNPQLN